LIGSVLSRLGCFLAGIPEPRSGSAGGAARCPGDPKVIGQFAGSMIFFPAVFEITSVPDSESAIMGPRFVAGGGKPPTSSG